MAHNAGQEKNNVKYAHIITEFYSQVWAIRPEKLHMIQELIRLRAAGGRFTDEEVRERIGATAPRKSSIASQPGSIAVIPIVGTISHRMNMMSEVSGGGGTSVQKLTAQFRTAVKDPNVKAIVLDVDSPGGSVDGIAELAAEIFDARKTKPVIAVANTQAASAAYWLASSAKELVVAPSGQVGSIGVFGAHEDLSKHLENDGVHVSLISAGKYKVEGNPYEPLSDEARAAMQAKVDGFYSMFTKAVARGRGVAQAKVKDGFGQGRMEMAADAVAQGMADWIGTLDDVLAKYGASSGSTRSGSAASSNSGTVAGPQEDDAAEMCTCACDACKACNTKAGKMPAPDPENEPDEDDYGPNCCGQSACEACQACTYKSDDDVSARTKGARVHPAVLRRRRELDMA